jgi:hypothetical protein
VLPQFEMGESVAVWRVFWVPQNAVRTGYGGGSWRAGRTCRRERIKPIKAADPIFLSPDHRVDPLLGLYLQSSAFRRYTTETKRNYATDIRLLLTFLWGRGKAWTDAVQRDLEDYEHWRRFAAENPDRIGGGEVGARAGDVRRPVRVGGQERLRGAEPDRDEAGPRPERRRGDGAGGAGEGRPAVQPSSVPMFPPSSVQSTSSPWKTSSSATCAPPEAPLSRFPGGHRPGPATDR